DCKGTSRIAQRCGVRQIERLAADEPAGLQAAFLQKISRQRSRCSLAMRAGHDNRPARLQHREPQPLRKTDVRQPAIENRFELSIAAAERIADYHDVRPPIEIRRRITREYRYIERRDEI